MDEGSIVAVTVVITSFVVALIVVTYYCRKRYIKIRLQERQGKYDASRHSLWYDQIVSDYMSLPRPPSQARLSVNEKIAAPLPTKRKMKDKLKLYKIKLLKV